MNCKICGRSCEADLCAACDAETDRVAKYLTRVVAVTVSTVSADKVRRERRWWLILAAALCWTSFFCGWTSRSPIAYLIDWVISWVS